PSNRSRAVGQRDGSGGSVDARIEWLVLAGDRAAARKGDLHLDQQRWGVSLPLRRPFAGDSSTLRAVHSTRLKRHRIDLVPAHELCPGHPTAYCQSSCFQPLVTASNTPAGTVFGEALPSGACPREFCGPDFLDATPDLSHVIVSSPAQLTSASAPEGGLYEWTGGRLQLISAPPEGQTGILRLAGSEKINTIPTTQAAPGE